MTGKRPYQVGYGRPPISTRFQSSGRIGRSRGPGLPREMLLGRKVQVTENGKTKKYPADKAFILLLSKMAMVRGGQIRRIALQLTEIVSDREPAKRRRPIVCSVYANPGEVAKPMRWLNAATLLDPYCPLARLVIEPWMVEAALARLGDRQMTVAEQQIVVDATRKPSTVNWPKWWSVFST